MDESKTGKYSEYSLRQSQAQELRTNIHLYSNPTFHPRSGPGPVRTHRVRDNCLTW